MKTASIRQVRHDFSRILEWVASGEEVTITKRRQTVARLIPATPKKTVHVKMPDVTARLQKVFGRKVVSDKMMKQILDDNRGSF